MARGIRSLDILSHVRVASPCPASWSSMAGDERVRFCDQCHLHVYNLSAMTREDAARLVLEREGRLCVRFYQRADGTMLTQDCPRGWRLAKRRAGQMLVRTAAIGVACFAAAIGLAAVPRGAGSLRMRFFQPFSWVPQWEARITNWLWPVTNAPTLWLGAMSDPHPYVEKWWLEENERILDEAAHQRTLQSPNLERASVTALRWQVANELIESGALPAPRRRTADRLDDLRAE